jgi:hypothetical protein
MLLHFISQLLGSPWRKLSKLPYTKWLQTLGHCSPPAFDSYRIAWLVMSIKYFYNLL